MVTVVNMKEALPDVWDGMEELINTAISNAIYDSLGIKLIVCIDSLLHIDGAINDQVFNNLFEFVDAISYLEW